MLIPVRSVRGLAGIPAHRTSATIWLRKRGVALMQETGDGRRTALVRLSDLPEPVRLAYAVRRSQERGLVAGAYDDAAHKALMEAPASLRDEAERRAEIARFVLGLAGKLSLAGKA